MQNLTFIPTAEKVEVLDYPYGYSLRTTLYDTIEFNPKKGYRHITQTINPKNGRLNAPKKSTYYNFMLRYKNADGHIKTMVIDFNKSLENMNEVANKVSKVWDILSDVEKHYIIVTFKQYLKVSCIASVQYAGLDKDVATAEYVKLKDYINSFANIEEKKVKGKFQDVIVSYNTDSNIWLDLPQIDVEAIKNATPENYNPFKVSSHQI